MLFFNVWIRLPAELAWWLVKRKPLSIAISILLLLSFGSNLDSGYYMGKWMPIAMAATLFAAARLYESYGLALATNFVYCMGNGIWLALANNRYSTVQPYDLQAIKLFSIEASWKLGLAAFPLLYLASAQPRPPLASLRKLGRAFAVCFFLISAVFAIGDGLLHGCKAPLACGGSLMNPSINAAFMAVLLPLMPFPLAFAGIAAICAFIGKTSIGAGMVAIYVGGWVYSRVGRKWAVLSILAPAAVLFLGYYTHQQKEFFDSSGRFQMWGFFMRLWAVNPKNWLFGTGFGTFGVFSINLQHAFHMNAEDWWIWAHNDWLEHVFAGGAVGALLLVWLYLSSAWRLLQRGFYPELSSLLLFGVGMGCEYFPHIGPCCAFAVWLLAVSLLKVDIPDCAPQNTHIGETQ